MISDGRVFFLPVACIGRSGLKICDRQNHPCSQWMVTKIRKTCSMIGQHASPRMTHVRAVRRPWKGDYLYFYVDFEARTWWQ